ncbi:uncharacterized protein LOC132559524 [Ylistrum balloti]|uniref:uncharacterized protein LOC132559524 n=1 Tax=Ylistrum balloti TaxID=509963 RepID=UPI002905BB4A|nr:uncharacterized protein LOC132559524 [Ylistrum balloti]
MSDQAELYEKSWILHRILDEFIGNKETVAVKRKLLMLDELFTNSTKDVMKKFHIGSSCDGLPLLGSDGDLMYMDSEVIVIGPDLDMRTTPDSSVLMMRDANSRPGYVTLELVHFGYMCMESLMKSIVPVGDSNFISSEIYSRNMTDIIGKIARMELSTRGPASSLMREQSDFDHDEDFVVSFPCSSWPRQANEWIHRLRLHDWPSETLRDQIIKGGCHLVPVGDKTSDNPFLQWRISFTIAERKLLYSLTRVQFLVYGLLKYFLKQISNTVSNILGEADLISSYIIKTILFHTLESTPQSLWQEKNTFLCFMLCFTTLISWLKVGYCPNYFVNTNNMFLGKFQGERKQKLLQCLIGLHDMKWGCLSVGTFIQPTIGTLIDGVWNRELALAPPRPSQLEAERDMYIFLDTFVYRHNFDSFPVTMTLLCNSNTDLEEFVGYFTTLKGLAHTGMIIFGKQNSSRGNKQRYKYLRKCKNFLKPLASLCTSPGLLTLATYHYQTGNYVKTLELCGQMISSSQMYVGDMFITCERKNMYEHLWCGQGHSLYYKCREACVSDMTLEYDCSQFCPPQLHLYFQDSGVTHLSIPPLPYALFLSFLCYLELGDTRRRDAALIHLRTVKDDEDQGSGKHLIVHKLLRICYEMVGDIPRAYWEYRNSLGGHGPL